MNHLSEEQLIARRLGAQLGKAKPYTLKAA